jgi:hypothetical protein
MTYIKSCIIIIIIIDTLIYCTFKITDCPETVLILPISFRRVFSLLITFPAAFSHPSQFAFHIILLLDLIRSMWSVSSVSARTVTSGKRGR